MGVELPVEVPVYELLAEELARSGVAVLRYDKRTCVKNAAPRCAYPREPLASARDDLAGAPLDDAKAALKVARDPPRVACSCQSPHAWIPSRSLRRSRQ
mgnify:CR=1 FL=1